MQDLAIIAGKGRLPEVLSQKFPHALVVSFQGSGLDFEPENHFIGQFEKAGAMFKALKKNGTRQICFAGAIARPSLDMKQMDLKTIKLLPRIQKAISSADGKALNVIRSLVEGEGYIVKGAHELFPEMLVELGQIGNIAASDGRGLDRAVDIHVEMSRLDIGQALAMRWGQVLAMESLFGTEKMLKFVTDNTDPTRKAEGFLFKASKVDQDLKLDMASIGPDTISQAVNAGLAGIYLRAEQVIMIDKAEIIERANKAGIFLQGVK